MRGGRWLRVAVMLTLLSGLGCCRWCERSCPSTACAPAGCCPQPCGCAQPVQVTAQPAVPAGGCGCAPCPAPYGH